MVSSRVSGLILTLALPRGAGLRLRTFLIPRIALIRPFGLILAALSLVRFGLGWFVAGLGLGLILTRLGRVLTFAGLEMVLRLTNLGFRLTRVGLRLALGPAGVGRRGGFVRAILWLRAGRLGLAGRLLRFAGLWLGRSSLFVRAILWLRAGRLGLAGRLLGFAGLWLGRSFLFVRAIPWLRAGRLGLAGRLLRFAGLWLGGSFLRGSAFALQATLHRAVGSLGLVVWTRFRLAGRSVRSTRLRLIPRLPRRGRRPRVGGRIPRIIPLLGIRSGDVGRGRILGRLSIRGRLRWVRAARQGGVRGRRLRIPVARGRLLTRLIALVSLVRLLLLRRLLTLLGVCLVLLRRVIRVVCLLACLTLLGRLLLRRLLPVQGLFELAELLHVLGAGLGTLLRIGVWGIGIAGLIRRGRLVRLGLVGWILRLLTILRWLILGLIPHGRRLILRLVGLWSIPLFFLLLLLLLLFLGRQWLNNLDKLADGFDPIRLRFLGVSNAQPVFDL